MNKKDIISNLQAIYFDLKYLREKVLMDKEIKEEISQRMVFMDETVNAIVDGIIIIKEEQ